MPTQTDRETIDAIKNEYITSDDPPPSFRALSKKFDICKRTVDRYAGRENWVKLRKDYWHQKEAQREAIAATAKTFYEMDLVAVAKQQHESTQHFIDIATIFALSTKKAIKETCSTPQEINKFLKDRSSAINTMNQVLDRSLKIQQDITGLKAIASDETAVQYLISKGYSVVESEYLEELEQAHKQLSGQTTIEV